LTEVAPTYLREPGGGRNVPHELVPLLRQQQIIFQLAEVAVS